MYLSFDLSIRHGIVCELGAQLTEVFFPDCGSICGNLYVEAKHFGFIHKFWNHPLIMGIMKAQILNIKYKLIREKI